MQITNEVLEGFLNCKTKGHLKLSGEGGTPSDYETMTAAAWRASREEALAKLTARFGDGDSCRGLVATAAALKKGAPLLTDVTLEGDDLSIRLDALKRAEGTSKLGAHHYLPVLHNHGEKVCQTRKVLLAVFGLVLARIQGQRPESGVIIRGPDARLRKVLLDAKLYRQAEQILAELARLQAGGEPPRLMLNEHCQVCEFRQRCREVAVREDNLSLLRGLGEKEIRSFARKGVLTLTQLAHTFRPRRKGKRVVRKTNHRYHALQALALRDQRIYIFGTPALPDSPVKVYLDIEGVPDEGFVYLVGMIIVEGDTEKRFSFWADTKEQERDIFDQFLAELGRYSDFRVFCYGSYERTFLRRLRKLAKRKGPVDRVMDRLVNVLSVLYAHVYFPCYSNGLKDVARCLECSWAAPDASGLQSLVWRARWEAGHADEWKEKLLTYNRDDCTALRRVAEFISAIGSKPGLPDSVEPTGASRPPVASVEELDRLGLIARRGKIDFFHADFAFINTCGHFDYQRQRVYIRSGRSRQPRRKRPPRLRNRRLRVSQRVQIICRKCPACGGAEVIQWPRGKRVTGYSIKHKRAFDLVFSPSGIKRRVIECTTSVHECAQCGEVFVPERYQRLAKHFHGLRSWAMHEHVAHRIGCPMLKEMLKDFFGLSVCQQELNRFKRQMALYYRACTKRLFTKILASKVLQIDETEVKLRTGKAYVWVFATAEEVVYVLRPTREGDFLAGLLKDFKGVLVSDFYAAYDSLECPQQKCLIHLIRDMNQELLNNPFDQELQSITGPFGILLRSLVEAIDRHGLKHRHLGRYQGEVDQFFESVAAGTFRSEAAESLRARLLKYRNKLFTFIQFDDVPWNNNNSENAIRQFAYYREANPGRMREPGLEDHLVLLSLYQTCRYRGVSFLKFLLSRERDLDAFCRRPRRRKRVPVIEVYPKGVDRPDFGPTRADAEVEEMSTLAGEWSLIERVSPDGNVTRHDVGPAAAAAQRVKVVFREGMVTTEDGWPAPPNRLEGRCRLHPKRRPKIIDIVRFDASFPRREWKGSTTRGIYELDGDRLRLCIPDDGTKRPSDFEPGPGKWIYTLHRNKR